MYRLSKLRWVFPIGLLVALFLDGSLSHVFSGIFFHYPSAMSSQLLLLWLVLSYFFEGDTHIPVVGFAALAGAICDLYYSGIWGLFLFLYPAIVMLTRLLARYMPTSFLSHIMIFFVDITVFELLNYWAYSVIGVTTAGFGDFLAGVLAPTLALNLIYFVIFYFPIARLFNWAEQEKYQA